MARLVAMGEMAAAVREVRVAVGVTAEVATGRVAQAKEVAVGRQTEHQALAAGWAAVVLGMATVAARAEAAADWAVCKRRSDDIGHPGSDE